MVNGNRELKSIARQIKRAEGIPYTEALAIARLRMNEMVITIREQDEVKLQLVVSTATHPYAHEDIPVYAQIELPDGLVVLAFDYGFEGYYTLKDGAEVQSWVHPMYLASADGEPFKDEEPAAKLITAAEFSLLEEADFAASQFFIEDVELRGSKGQRGGAVNAKELTSAQLFDIVKKTMSTYRNSSGNA